MKFARRTALRPPPRKGRCPLCGRTLTLYGVSGRVLPPHTARRGILHPDGTVTASGPYCIASCTRTGERLRDPGAQPRRDAPEGGAA